MEPNDEIKLRCIEMVMKYYTATVPASISGMMPYYCEPDHAAMVGLAIADKIINGAAEKIKAA